MDGKDTVCQQRLSVKKKEECVEQERESRKVYEWKSDARKTRSKKRRKRFEWRRNIL